MEKVELVELVKSKFDERNIAVEYTDGELNFTAKDIELTNNRAVVDADFKIGGTDFMHTVGFVIKCPVSLHGDYDSFLQAVNKINSSISTGKYFLEGDGNNAMFCCTYSTTFFNTEQERMNVDRIMMFMFDSLILEYSDILKTI